MRRAFRQFDPWLFWLALAASLLGMLFVFDAGYPRSIAAGRSVLPREFIMQAMYFPIAIFASLLCSRIAAERWKRLSPVLWWIGFASLFLVFAPVIGVMMNGAHRWIKLGVMIQPAEFVKFTCILYLAWVFADRKSWPEKIKWRTWVEWADRVLTPKFLRMLPGFIVLVAIILIEKEPDMGTGAVVAFIAASMMFLGGITRKSVWAIMILSALLVFVAVKQEPYRMERILNHFHRWDRGTMDDTGFQTIQSELAMASGGVTGVGVANGRAKHVEPAPTTDFIMATIGEEFGLLGVLTVLLVLGALVVRLLALAARAPTKFGSLVLAGTASWIGIQTAVNLMMANGTLPAIGIPVPFVSSGGSSLLALWMAVGLCQAVIVPQTVEEGELAPSRHRWWNRRARLSRA